MSNVAFPAVVMSGPKPSLNSPIKLGFPVIVTQLAGSLLVIIFIFYILMENFVFGCEFNNTVFECR